jgi:hypothetical protein
MKSENLVSRFPPNKLGMVPNKMTMNKEDGTTLFISESAHIIAGYSYVEFILKIANIHSTVMSYREFQESCHMA